MPTFIQEKLDNLRKDTENKFQKTDTMMFFVIVILIVMVVNILVIISLWGIDTIRDNNKNDCYCERMINKNSIKDIYNN